RLDRAGHDGRRPGAAHPRRREGRRHAFGRQRHLRNARAHRGALREAAPGSGPTRFRGRGLGALTGPARIRILLVEDQTLVREGLRSLLGFAPDLEVAGEAADGEEALAMI